MRGDGGGGTQRREKRLQAGQIRAVFTHEWGIPAGLERWACRGTSGGRDIPAGPHKGRDPEDREPALSALTQTVVGEKLEHSLGTDHRESGIQGMELGIFPIGNREPTNQGFWFFAVFFSRTIA